MQRIHLQTVTVLLTAVVPDLLSEIMLHSLWEILTYGAEKGDQWCRLLRICTDAYVNFGVSLPRTSYEQQNATGTDTG